MLSWLPGSCYLTILPSNLSLKQAVSVALVTPAAQPLSDQLSKLPSVMADLLPPTPGPPPLQPSPRAPPGGPGPDSRAPRAPQLRWPPWRPCCPLFPLWSGSPASPCAAGQLAACRPVRRRRGQLDWDYFTQGPAIPTTPRGPSIGTRGFK